MEKVSRVFRESLISNIKNKVKSNQSVFLLSYSAIPSAKMDSFRKDLKKMGAEVYVAKNRIAKLALKELDYEKLAKNINGQTAFVWTNADSSVISKSLLKFSDDLKSLSVQGGLVDGAVLEKADIKRLSDLPSREVLVSQLLQTMLSPLTRFAGVLNGKSRDLLSILKQLSERKGGS